MIKEDWDSRINSWSVMLPLLVNATSTLAVLQYLNVPNRDNVITTLQEMINSQQQQLEN